MADQQPPSNATLAANYLGESLAMVGGMLASKGSAFMVLHAQRTIALGPHCQDRQVEPGASGPVIGLPVSDLDTIRLGSSHLFSAIGYKE